MRAMEKKDNRTKKKKLFSNRQNMMMTSPLSNKKTEIDIATISKNKVTNQTFVPVYFTDIIDKELDKLDSSSEVEENYEPNTTCIISNFSSHQFKDFIYQESPQSNIQQHESDDETVSEIYKVKVKKKHRKRKHSEGVNEETEESFELKINKKSKKKKKKKSKSGCNENQHDIKSKTPLKQNEGNETPYTESSIQISDDDFIELDESIEPDERRFTRKKDVIPPEDRVQVMEKRVDEYSAGKQAKMPKKKIDDLLQRIETFDPDHNLDESNPSQYRRVTNLYECEDACDKHPLLLSMNATHEEMRKACVPFASGKWTKKELHILLNNIKQFQKKYAIQSFAQFYASFNTSRCESDGIDSKKKFFIAMAESLFRPLRSIRAELDFIYLDKNEEHAGNSYTTHELKRLIKLQKVYGSDWVYISSVMKRTPESLSRRFNMLVEEYNIRHGNPDITQVPDDLTIVPRAKKCCRFTPEEDSRLKRAVEKFTDEETLKTDWKKVAGSVRTRNSRTCQMRWRHFLDNTTATNIKKITTFQRENPVNRYKLTVRCLRIIITANIRDKNDINWNRVAAGINMKNYTDGGMVCRIFHETLQKNVPDQLTMTFEEILLYLLDHRMNICYHAAERKTMRKEEIRSMFAETM